MSLNHMTSLPKAAQLAEPGPQCKHSDIDLKLQQELFTHWQEAETVTLGLLLQH